MALTQQKPTTYATPAQLAPYRPLRRTAVRYTKLFWASGILFCANVLVLFGIAISPEWKVDMYGQAEETVGVEALKPTPFVQPVLETRRSVRTAPKLQPVIETATSWNESELEIPVRSVVAYGSPRSSSTTPGTSTVRPSNYISGDSVYTVVENEANYPRMSASAMKRGTSLPRSTPAEMPRKTSVLN